VPAALEQLVAKCLEKKAADRWQTAEELIPQLEALATPSGGVTPVATAPLSAVARGKKTAVVAAVFAALIAVVVVVILMSRRSGDMLDTRRVAVAPFENLTGEDSLDLHGQVAASWITDGLQQVDVLSVVPWMAVQQEASALEGENPVRELAEITGAGIVVSGNYSRHGDSLRFRAEITDPRRMEVLHTVPPVSGLSTDPGVAFDALAERIAGALAVMLDTAFGEMISKSMRRPTFAAYRESVTGADLYSRGRYDAAIEHLTTAYELDTSFIASLMYAASAHLNRGSRADADSLIGIAERSWDRLSRRERLTLSWLRARQRGAGIERLRASRGLAESHPIWMYQSGYDAMRVNRPQEAVEALERVDPARGWMKEWVNYWDQLTAARHMLGDHRSELRNARRGREQHPDRLLVFNYEARALAALGRVDEATLLFDEILGLPPDPSWGHAEPVVFAGLCFRAHGYSEAAQEVFRLALDRLSSFLPHESQSRSYRHNLGQTLYWSERWDEAREVFLQLVMENPDNVEYKGHLGVAHARSGNVDEASTISDELALMDRPYLLGSNTLWRARITAVLGDRGHAFELLRQAFTEGIDYGIWLHRDIDFESLRDYPPFQELIKPK
ncbi:MAG: tetratricopeptide repeat protein, partial [Gemmatimonadota bacterium]